MNEGGGLGGDHDSVGARQPWRLTLAGFGPRSDEGDGFHDAAELVAEDRDTTRLVRVFQRAHGRESAKGECERCFSLLHIRYSDRIDAYMRGKLRNPVDADEAAGAVWERVWKALPTYQVRSGTPFRAWLYTVAR